MNDSEKLAIMRLLFAIEQARERLYFSTPLSPDPHPFQRSLEGVNAERQRRDRALYEAMDVVRKMIEEEDAPACGGAP